MATPTSLLKGFAKTVATVKPDPAKRLTISDPDTRGLYVRVTPAGAKTWTVVARNPQGKQVWAALGDCDHVTLEEAREKAKEGVRRIRAGEEAFPKERPVEMFEAVLDTFINRHVKKVDDNGKALKDQTALRSAKEVERVLNKYVRPKWKGRVIHSIKRSEITALLDNIESNSGPVQADRVLAQLSKFFTWYASRGDDFFSPIVRGMRRTRASERERDRTLTDDEIRSLWTEADKSGAFGVFLQLLVLTGQRRAKLMAMRWGDIDEKGVWTIPTEAREKGNPGVIALPQMARDVLAKLTPVEGNPHVFAGRGKTALAMGDKLKKDFDARAKLSAYRLHDLRRTAKTLMSRARVDDAISERVLGHAIGGVKGVYDRHAYFDEKKAALETLATLIALILNPRQDNVVPLERAS